MQTQKRRLCRLFGALAVMAVFSCGYTASALEGYPDGRLSIVSEPTNTSSYVQYFKDGESRPLSELTWSDNGKSGKAVVLDGKTEYLQVGYNQLHTSHLTFAGWMYWKGAASESENAAYGQRLFTLSNGEKTFLTVSPHMRDTARVDGNGDILDGVFLGFTKGGTAGKIIERWNPATDGVETYAIPQNEWHHIAVVADGVSLKMYIDGKLWFEDVLVMGIVELNANRLTVGTGLWGDPTLNAMLDDVALYNSALTETQVHMLAHSVDPLSADASLPETEKPFTPDAPTVSQTIETISSTNDTITVSPTETLFGIPKIGVYIMIGIVVVFVMLSVTLSIYHSKADAKKGKTGGDQE